MSAIKTIGLVAALGLAGYAGTHYGNYGNVYAQAQRASKLEEAVKDITTKHFSITNSPDSIIAVTLGSGNATVVKLPNGQVYINGILAPPGSTQHGSTQQPSEETTPSDTEAGNPSPPPFSGTTPREKVYHSELLGSGVTIWYTNKQAYTTLESAIKPILDLRYNQRFLDLIEQDSEFFEKIPPVIAEFYTRALRNNDRSDFSKQGFDNRSFVESLVEKYDTGAGVSGAKRFGKKRSGLWIKNILGLKEEGIEYAGLSQGFPLTSTVANASAGQACHDYNAVLEAMGNVETQEEPSHFENTPAAEAPPAQEPQISSRQRRGTDRSSRQGWTQGRRQYGDWLGRAQTPTYRTGQGANWWSNRAVYGGQRHK